MTAKIYDYSTIIPPTYVTQSEELYDKGVNPKTAQRLTALHPPLYRAADPVRRPDAVRFRGIGGRSVLRQVSPSTAASTPGTCLILRYTLLAFLGVSVIQWVCTYYRVNIMAWVGKGIIYDLRKRLFDHLQELSLGFYSRYSVGRVITRAINDVETLRDFLTWAVLAIARDIFTLA